jgi:hypothetical protein
LLGFAAQQQPKSANILVVREETQSQDRDGTDATRVINPDEINIDCDEDEADDSEYSVVGYRICFFDIHVFSFLITESEVYI